MAAITAVNSKAEVARARSALAVNICAARGLQDVLRTNLGPKGTMKMLISGAGDIKLTKDGNVLLHEMQIQHPTASLIAKVATAQDDITGDGTTSNVLIIGELLKQADLYISEGLHPRIIAEGFEAAKIKALEVLEKVKINKEMKREVLLDVARTSLQTKVPAELADVLTEGIDPFSLDALAKHGIVALRRAKRRNMESYDDLCNFRLSLACGGMAVNSLEDLSIHCLGHAGLVHECTLGEEKFTFIEACVNPRSVTLLVKGPNKHTLTQIKDALRDGLRAIKNAIEDGCVVPGAGAVEVAIAEALVNYKHSVKGRVRLGVQAFANALLIIPKVLAQNSGYDLQETLVKVQAEHSESKQPVGIDLNTGEPMLAADAGVWDNYCVKKQLLHSCTVIATNILLVDEIMRAGMSSLKG
ncbi:T-complex protein 1 subunit zeta-2 isoform X1 [Panthera tigris]|uniref:T-complex protein 1 subunit zeta-2 isoform X1 n=1 Tax=Panthera tigris TaxID=9694 RepID=UPI001C6F8E1E|nr:T-complex protein 1 subunit zeta-2 isoform X1 [Panthera tigris]